MNNETARRLHRAHTNGNLEIVAGPVPTWHHRSPVAIKPKFVNVLDEYLALRESISAAEAEAEFPAFIDELRERKDVVGSELNNFFESLGG